jgi:fatty-acyl-CoA synthase
MKLVSRSSANRRYKSCMGLIRAAIHEVRNAAMRARTVRRVATKTGLVAGLRSGGVKALLASRGKSSPVLVFRYHAQNQPHRTALVYRDRSYSFFELDAEIEAAARGLTGMGIGRGDAIVVMLKNRPEFLFAQAGAARMGAASVSASSRCTSAELRYQIENSNARALLFEAASAAAVEPAVEAVREQLGDRVFAVGGEVPGFASYEDLKKAAAGQSSPPLDAAEDGSVIIYTSGTTGKPKGAVRRFQKDAVVTVLSFIGETPMRAGQTHLAVCPLYHSTAFGFITFSFILGNKVVLLDGFEPEAFLDALEHHRVNHTAVVPTMLHRLMQLGPEAIEARDLSELRAIFTGGAQLTPRLSEEVLGSLGDKLFNFYGSTETGLVSLAKPHDLRAAPGTIGRAVPGNEIRLLDEQGAPCAPGDVGELYVRSGALVEGYHANEAATRASMRDGFFSVGDLARCDERGYYFIEGRKRDMVISGGVNVYPREVETALLRHPAVSEAAVIGVPDDEWGERVRAFVVLRPGASCNEVELLAHCREDLAGPKRPREVRFVDALPRNPTGKVLKRELREL